MSERQAPAAYDVLVVGGGPVGAALVLALAGRGLRIGLIEAVAWEAGGHPAYDDRAVALAEGSRRILETLGLWAALAPHATAIHDIVVSERGRPGVTRLGAVEAGLAALGQVVTARDLGDVLGARLRALTDVDLLCPAEVESVEVDADAARVMVRRGEESLELVTRLLVGADGAHSVVRRQSGIEASRRPYGHVAITANITPERAPGHTAHERFTPEGPLAVLPLGAARCAVICTVAAGAAAKVMALDDADFLRLLEARLGERVGPIRAVGRRQAHPLTLVHAARQVAPRTVLIGNAAHTAHPIAGQGFNLGLRDVAALAETVLARAGADPGDAAALREYARWRAGDQWRTLAATDALVRLFAPDCAPLAWARSAGLVALDVLPPLKRALVRQAAGLAGRLPRLARGLVW